MNHVEGLRYYRHGKFNDFFFLKEPCIASLAKTRDELKFDFSDYGVSTNIIKQSKLLAPFEFALTEGRPK